jgi:phi13 family phage major tail protein
MAISANSGEYYSRIGLDSLYVALVTEDSASAYVAGTPETLAPAAEASQEPSTSMEIQYADDLPFDVANAEGPTKITLKLTGLPPEMQALITGAEFDPTTGRVYDNGGVPPYFALSFRSLKSNGSYRYYQYLKGKFSMPKEDTSTRGEKPEPKTQDLEFTAIFTTHQFDLGDINGSAKRVYGDEDTTAFDPTGWFTQVQVPGAATPSALALSSSLPTDGATNVVITVNQTLTFNNALVDAAPNGVTLIKASDGTVVAGTKTLDATKKIITIDPTASLSTSTAYIIVYAVTDIYGQTLNGAVNFETAAP